MKTRMTGAAWLVAACCMLGLYGTSGAQVPQAPFANAVDLQAEVIQQLKELNAQMKEQNALLRSGRLQVIVVERSSEKSSPGRGRAENRRP